MPVNVSTLAHGPGMTPIRTRLSSVTRRISVAYARGSDGVYVSVQAFVPRADENPKG